MISRRSLLLSAAGVSASCRRRKASGYSGFAFIANQEGEAIAAVDLTVFAVARHIHVTGRPSSVVAHPTEPLAYALTPENGTVHEIRADTLTASRRVRVATTALAIRLAPDGESLFVLCRQPRSLVRFDLRSFRVAGAMPLPAEPADFDLDRTGRLAAISYQSAPFLSLAGTESDRVGPPLEASGNLGAIRFRSDSQAIIAANLSGRMLAIYQVSSRKLEVNLALAVRPDQLCFKADGGELFVTGEGMDGVVVVDPYYIPQVAETVLAGHAPGAMAASVLQQSSPQYLFVANPRSGDVSILNIAKRRVMAVTPVGTEPGSIIFTPDDQYALILNRGSGDLAVIRIANVTRAASDFKRSRKGPIFMMVPVGSRPVSAAIVPI